MRTAKFVARKQWVITGADDMYIRVYNHNTMEKIKSFEAHTDYIRRGACCASAACLVTRMVLDPITLRKTSTPEKPLDGGLACTANVGV